MQRNRSIFVVGGVKVAIELGLQFPLVNNIYELRPSLFCIYTVVDIITRLLDNEGGIYLNI